MTAFPSSNLFASPRTPMRVARSTMLVISPPVRLAGERHFWFTRRGFRNDTLGLELLGKCRTFTNASERDSRFESSQLRHPVHENRGGFRVWRNFGHNSDLPGDSVWLHQPVARNWRNFLASRIARHRCPAGVSIEAHFGRNLDYSLSSAMSSSFFECCTPARSPTYSGRAR